MALLDKHVEFILSLEQKYDPDAIVMKHLRMNGAFWGIATLDLMGHLGKVDHTKVTPWILQCQHECGGFSGNLGHDPHILSTLSAVQVLALYDKLHLVDADKIASYIAGLQQQDGSFAGDEYGEIDTRFSYCAVCCLALLRRLDRINVEKATEYIVRCKNFDGGFGNTPGGESHSGQIFCCVSALNILGALHHVDNDVLGWWLCERQVKSGGLNGRPEKDPDVSVDVFFGEGYGFVGLLLLVGALKLGDPRSCSLDRSREAQVIHFGVSSWLSFFFSLKMSIFSRMKNKGAFQIGRTTLWMCSTRILESLVSHC